jgi:hypothetical protein
MNKKIFQTIIGLTFFIFAITGCGGLRENSQSEPTQNNSTSSTTTTSPLVSAPGTPGNLPPPSTTHAEQVSEPSLGAQNTIFFQRKDVWDEFSDKLKSEVQGNYAHSASLTGAGAGGHGYYNTLFGRVSPVFRSSRSSFPLIPLSINGGGGPFVFKALSATIGCDATSSFLCISKPQDGDSTVVDAITVTGAINLDETAQFTSTDPVILISVFRQSGEALNEYPLAASDITVSSSGSPQIGTFSKTVGLSGPDSYTITVSAFKNSGDSVELISLAATVIRQDVPQIELVSLLPPESPDPGNLYLEDSSKRHDPVQTGNTVSMSSVKATVKLSSPGTGNVGIIFQNLDEKGNLFYSSDGDSSFGATDPAADGTTLPTKSATLPLLPGLNHIRITAHNDSIDALYESQGLPPPPPSTIDVNLTNMTPSVNIRLLSPKDGSIVKASNYLDEKVEIQYCLTDLPALPGRPAPSSPGHCIQEWSGEKPVVTFNGAVVSDGNISLDHATGVYTAQVDPQIGGNVIKIAVTNAQFSPAPDQGKAAAIGNLTASFGYGKVHNLFVNGALNEDRNFLHRGLSVEVDKGIITRDAKKMLFNYLNGPDFKETFAKAFKNDATTPDGVCTELGAATVEHGNTSLEFINSSLTLGNGANDSTPFEISELEPTDLNKLNVTVKLKGLHADANLVGLTPTSQATYHGEPANWPLPLRFDIGELKIRIALTFKKEDGISKIDIVRRSRNSDAVQIVGDDQLGNFVSVDSSRNAAAIGFEELNSQTGIIRQTIKDSFEKAVLCNVENGLNHPTAGLGKWETDLKKLVDYNNLNPFRIPIEFELLNNLIGIDIAYDLLRGDITFNGRGVQIKNVPIRISPSPRILNHLVSLFGGSISQDALTDQDKQLLSSPSKDLIGSLSSPISPQDPPPAEALTNDVRNVSVELSEDAINQVLFSANLNNLLDLEIDPNFYTNNKINFIDQATPTLQDMLGVKIDLNQNGLDDDDRLPVQLRVRTDKTIPPTLHFLSQDELNNFAQAVNASLNNSNNGSSTSNTTSGSSASKQKLNPNLKIFRLSLANLDLAFYRVYPLSADVGGVKNFCHKKEDIADADASSRALVPPLKVTGDPNGNALKPACAQPVAVFTEKTGATCGDAYEEKVVPVKNGPVISAVPEVSGEDPAPLVRFKVNLVLHGVIEGVYREVLFADKNKDPHAKPKNFVRIKLLPVDFGSSAFLADLHVVENHTSFTEEQLGNRLKNGVLPVALSNDCAGFNEIRIPVPDRFPSATTTSSSGLVDTLKKLGVDYLEFGNDDSNLPQAFVDDNRLYVDVLAHLGVCFEGEECK